MLPEPKGLRQTIQWHAVLHEKQENRMNKIFSFPLMAIAMLAATSGAAQAQHVVGGMGEEVRIGAFGGRADNYMGGRGLPDSHGLNAAGRDRVRTRAIDRHGAPATSARGKVPTLPGRHLP
ncbi:hypothetical protein CS8_079550 [Cupriavidus sp. 8B]